MLIPLTPLTPLTLLTLLALLMPVHSLEQVSSPKWAEVPESFVVFYTDWCSVSQRLLSTLEPILASVPVPSFKYEASKDFQSFALKSFPQLLYRNSNLTLFFESEKTPENLESWVRARADPQVSVPSLPKSQLRAPEELCPTHASCLIARGLSLELLQEIARRVDIKIFSIEGPPSITLHLNYADKAIEYQSSFEIEQITSFISYHLAPNILPLERVHLDKLFNSGGNAVVLLRERRSRGLDGEIEGIGDRLKGKLKLLIVDVSVPVGKQVQEVLRIPDKKLPALRIVECRGGSLNVTQFDIADTITTENIFKFVNNWENGLAKSYVLTQEIPKKQTENLVLCVVQETFAELVNASTQNVLLVVYAPWCTYSRSLLAKLEQLSYDFRQVSNLQVAKIDGYNNEIGKTVRGFPTIQLYFSQDGERKVVEYQDERVLPKIKSFIHSYIKPAYKVDL